MNHLKAIRHQFLTVLLLIIVLISLGLRVINLGEKVYWVDEVSTSLRVSGYTRQALIQDISQRDSITIQELKQYQQLNPDRNWKDTISALTQSPEHAPLYFILLRIWQQIFGSSILATRTLSVLLNVLCFPLLYILCLELFKVVEVGKVAVTLFAVSPFFMAYAQEARPYSLWMLTLLLSSLTLLKVIRLNHPKSWLAYTLSLILGLYTSLFSGFTLISSTLYILTLKKLKLTKLVKNYSVYSGLGLLAFLPWIMIIILNWRQLQDNTTWVKAPMEFLPKVAIFIYSLSILFFDFLSSEQPSLFVIILGSLLTIFVLGLITFACYFLYQKTPPSIGLFVFCLILVNPLLLFLIDGISQGQASATSRYLIPCYLGLLLAVAYLLATQIFDFNSIKKRRFWRFILILILSVGLISCILYQEAVPVYQKGRNRHNLTIARLINQSEFPALITETQQIFDILSLSYQLNPNLTIYLLPQTDLEQILKPDQSLLLFNPSSLLKDKINQEGQFDLDEIYKPNLLTPNDHYLALWKIKKLQNPIQ